MRVLGSKASLKRLGARGGRVAPEVPHCAAARPGGQCQGGGSSAEVLRESTFGEFEDVCISVVQKMMGWVRNQNAG